MSKVTSSIRKWAEPETAAQRKRREGKERKYSKSLKRWMKEG